MDINKDNSANPGVLLLKQYWPCLLILLAVIGFQSKALYNYPIGLMAVLGFYKAIALHKTLYKDRVILTFFILFICLWLPLLISLIDAVNPEHSAHTVFPYLRFLFAGIFIIDEIGKDEKRLKLIIYAIFIIVSIWCLDASIQFFFGHNILGFPYDAFHGITGMFYPRNTISHVTSILSAFCFIVLFVYTLKYKWAWATLIPLFFVILISGRRAAWVMLALSSFGFFIYLYLYSVNKKLILKITSLITLVIAIALSSTIIFNKATNIRFMTTLGLFSTEFETIDTATAGRLSLWETAYTIFQSNKINGIGPRGYRHVFHDYASKDNFWYTDSAQTHPHLLILEILVETGLIGLTGYLLLLFLLIYGIFKRSNLQAEIPLLLPVLVALFPLNAHMAFYGSIWSSMSWLLIALFFSNIKLVSNGDNNKH